MSQRPSASRPASRSPPEGQRLVLPPVQLRHDVQQEGRHVARPQPEPESRGFLQHLPASQHAQTSQPSPPGEGWRPPRQSRDLGVHSILNPPESESRGNPNRRMSGGTNESPRSAAEPPFEPTASTGALHTFPGQQLSSGVPPVGEPHAAAFPTAPRRILTPNSPSARAVSVGRGVGVGTIDAHQTPFLGSRGRRYLAEPGPRASSEGTALPTPGPQQQQYSIMQAPGRTPLSQSASPSISGSSKNLSSGQDSPASFFLKGTPAPQPSSSYYPGSSFGTAIQAGGGMQFQGLAGLPEGPYTAPAPQSQCSSLHPSSASSSSQASASDPIQVLTITTSEGIYTVPVDVTAASREADSKRARNAGASARFRQRRKEKEKEANTNIDKLQQQTRDLERKLRDVEQERDRYRHERDRLRDLVYRNSEMRHMVMQGPPSPQSMRSGALQGTGQQVGAPPKMGFPEPESMPERGARRRRTDVHGAFTNPPYTLPPASTLTPVQAPSYPPGLESRGHPSLPPLRIDNPTTPQTPNLNANPLTSVGPPPPLGPYVRRSWDQGWSGDTGRR
ncbi:hypothetical protein QTJ16_001669 [Diplocarpon rosae]|uniref:BZIP domain-containing protein n=1 Tax=Diplocarpon rosae TaxID=946125 RepID=A0AAD9T319_9HELO|nr:hypothetical protein QTJ16_001669 [Diplocarpon rosae]